MLIGRMKEVDCPKCHQKGEIIECYYSARGDFAIRFYCWNCKIAYVNYDPEVILVEKEEQPKDDGVV